MSITKDQANTDATTAHDAIQAAANTNFYTLVDAQIQEAIAQGKFQVNCWTTEDVDLSTAFQYYADLGYAVSFPDYPTNLDFQPAQMFGAFWEDFWANVIHTSQIKNPARMIIAWR